MVLFKFKKFLISFLLFLLSSFSLIASEKSKYQPSIDAYNIRFINTEKSLANQLAILKRAKINKDLDIQLVSESILTTIYLREKDIKKAKKSIENAKDLFPKVKDLEAQAFYYFALWKFQFIIDDKNYEINLLKSLQLFEKTNNNFFSTINVVNLSYVSNRIDKMLMEKALKYAKLSKNNDAYIEALLCESSFLKEKYLDDKTEENQQIARRSYLKTIEISKKKGGLNVFNIAVAYLNYSNFLVLTNEKSDKIFPYLNKAILLSSKYRLLSIYRNSYGIKGVILSNEGKFNEAEKTFQEGIAYLNKMPYREDESKLTFYNSLKEISLKKQDFKKYAQYDSECLKLASSIKELQENEMVHKAIAKYELQSKDEKIALLSNENKLIMWLGVTTLLLLLISAVLYYYHNKLNKTKQLLVEETKIKLQKEKEQVQKELMNSILHIEKKNEILNNLKEKLTSLNTLNSTTSNKSIMKMIDDGILVDEDFDKFKDNFNEVYPEFFEKLQTQAQNSLTQLDLKYCGFMLMKLSNKEIASQMNVEPKSIRMARYRIKQKLQLTKEEDLDDFIQSIS
jgi:hypothetical protein